MDAIMLGESSLIQCSGAGAGTDVFHSLLPSKSHGLFEYLYVQSPFGSRGSVPGENASAH